MAPTGPPTMRVPLSEGKRQRPCRREGRTSNPRGKLQVRGKNSAPKKFLSSLFFSHSAPSPQLTRRSRSRSILCFAGRWCDFAVVRPFVRLASIALMGALLFSVMLTTRLGRSPSTTFNCGPCAESSLRCSVGLSTSHGAKDRSPGFFGRGNRVYS